MGGAALAQTAPQQLVVTYVEFKPADTKGGAQLLEELLERAETSSGIVNFDVLQQIDRPKFFALFEIWTSAQAFSDFQSSSATQAILPQLPSSSPASGKHMSARSRLARLTAVQSP